VIDAETGLSRRAFVVALLAVLAVAALLRGIFPSADPPWHTTVGIVWHDEGPWVHNARNMALFGAWSQDNWNPMYIAPVFTGLEYLSFKAFGVGVRQARVVPELLGLASVWLLALGVRRIGGRHAGLIAAALLATNYVYVMWNRAALMEGPMVAFIVASWYCYVRAQSRPAWGWLAGACALLAFFTKASAAFYVAALGLDAVITIALSVRLKGDATRTKVDTLARTAALATLGGLAAAGAIALALFVLPHWRDYWFYNVQMSITRKPSYDIRSLMDRVTGFPILHDLFTRSWFVLVVGTTAALGTLARWTRAAPGERLLVLWIGLGAAELMLHDVGNERRFIFFIPALVALAALALGGERTLLPPEAAGIRRTRAMLALPVVLFAAYVVVGAIVRVAFLYEVRPNVRLAAVLAAGFTSVLYVTWPRIPRALSQPRWSPTAGLAIALLVSAGSVAQYAQWATGRTYKNVEASRYIGRLLPAGTLVHGKLANGLALENRIRPIFVGRGFGNYDDRTTRDDVRYILTYVTPSTGYESQRQNPVILDVLDAYPDRRIVATFDVAETTTGHDKAALIDKFGSRF
jgi:4-amino-4-deoxy-L-arabinose transferase-like glycosyltransferase